MFHVLTCIICAYVIWRFVPALPLKTRQKCFIALDSDHVSLFYLMENGKLGFESLDLVP